MKFFGAGREANSDERRAQARTPRGRLARAAAVLSVAVPAVAIAPALPAQAVGAVGLVAAAGSVGYCGIQWGSLPRSSGSLSVAPVVNVRVGEHACYDRLVIDIAGRADGYRVEYVSEVTAEGSGAAVPVAGGARLQVAVLDPAHDPGGRATYHLPKDRSHLVPVAGYRTFRQVAWAGSFEGYTSFGLGVRARLPYRVFVLPGPGTVTRIVIDVAHRW